MFAGNTLSEREGYYWEVITTEGMQAQGEIAPLPGISVESLKKARHDAEQLVPSFQRFQWPQDKNELINKLRRDDALLSSCSSVRFAVESALITLAAASHRLSVAAYLGGSNTNVQSAFLLQGMHDTILAEAQQAWDQGFNVFKLKVGNRNIPLDVLNVQALRKDFGKDLVLRLDANQVWNMSEAILFAQSIGLENIAYLEEPMHSMDRINEFYQSTQMPVALDETLSSMKCGVTTPGRCMPQLTHHDGVVAYCIKPVVVGGIISSLDWIQEASDNGKQAVISSCFETSVGFGMVSALASLTNDVAGLGTQRFYEQ